jgi:hypothetical protein
LVPGQAPPTRMFFPNEMNKKSTLKEVQTWGFFCESWVCLIRETLKHVCNSWPELPTMNFWHSLLSSNSSTIFNLRSKNRIESIIYLRQFNEFQLRCSNACVDRLINPGGRKRHTSKPGPDSDSDPDSDSKKIRTREKPGPGLEKKPDSCLAKPGLDFWKPGLEIDKTGFKTRTLCTRMQRFFGKV